MIHKYTLGLFFTTLMHTVYPKPQYESFIPAVGFHRAFAATKQEMNGFFEGLRLESFQGENPSGSRVLN